ncbi:MAG: TetR/AcrR family transcriptional regulator [candidate division Zixibacteria bacterium]|nr:TetR/AcrR family transcriptional regulator [candidate division Zixibacteria bacterium]
MAGKRNTSTNRKQQIIDAATDLFANNSYERVTMSMVAKACNVTEPALYRYFSSKEKIYEAVLLSLSLKVDLEELAAWIKASRDIEEILQEIAGHILNNNLKHTELSRLLLLSSLEHRTLARQVFTAVRLPYIDLLIDELKRLREMKLIRDVNPVITARCFIGMIMDCAVSKNLWGKMQGERFQIEEVIENNVPIFARGLKE